MSTYLVTGTAGFIGSKVAELLLRDGHSVLGVDNLGAADARLKRWRLDQLRRWPALTLRCADIADRAEMKALFERDVSASGQRPSAVINLAGRAGVRYSAIDPWAYVDTNVTGTLNLLEMCRQFDVGKFVLASTSSLYGASCRRPFQEDADTDQPLSPYAASKKAAEAMAYTYHYLHGLDVTVLRYFTVYGPAGRPDMMPFRLVRWISEGRPVTVYGDGTQERDFTYVDDVARGTIAALRPTGHEVINLGSDQPIVLNKAIEIVESLVGRKAVLEYEPRHPADVPATWADIRKAGRLLDWRPRVSFPEGMQQLVSWYQVNRPWAKDVAA